MTQMEFWSLEQVYNSPLTEAMIVEAEAQLGVRLPEEYLELVRFHNGGFTKGFGFPTFQRTSWAEN